MTRVLLVGDMAPSGFGTVTADLGRAMLALDVDMRFVSQNEMGTIPPPFDSRTADLAFWEYQQGEPGVTGTRSLIGDITEGTSTALMMNGEPWGDWTPEAIILLGDFFAVRLLDARFGDAFRRVPTFHYVPIEGIDLPPLWGHMWRYIQPVAMSRFGQAEICKVTGTMPPMVYHGVDTTVFRPVSPSAPLIVPEGEGDRARELTLRSKEHCRAFFGLNPRAKIILRTDRHMPRKRYGSLIRAMDPVLVAHEDAQLVLHCRRWDQGGFLPDDISKMSEATRGRVIITDRSVPREVLVAIYNAADVYVSTSAEGFGLTIAEAIACGVPAVGLDYSAVPEVIGPAGVVVPVAQTYENEYSHRWAWPDEDRFADAVSWFLEHPARARETGAQGPGHVSRNFRWSDAAEAFLGLVTAALAGYAGPLPPEADEFTYAPVGESREAEALAA